ncbi:hypothetical protein TSOC_010591 [Tetrabaena socialis]|uniref:Uncharacterized protein n=1 Tax=Tetrabaena socialis TaxID=47790 RepID=A0A2J7ZSX4_9CHLO|nr:hypothetical protein TSOC_010591 [Tetrabaena socialis]|eukprot:PNH03362.1 hypothetical protein TSOC_010591 [Tetrabaena socialis]
MSVSLWPAEGGARRDGGRSFRGERRRFITAVRPTLLSSIHANLLGGWSSAWGGGTSYPKQPQPQRPLAKQGVQPRATRMPGAAQLQQQAEGQAGGQPPH